MDQADQADQATDGIHNTICVTVGRNVGRFDPEYERLSGWAYVSEEVLGDETALAAARRAKRAKLEGGGTGG